MLLNNHVDPGDPSDREASKVRDGGIIIVEITTITSVITASLAVLLALVGSFRYLTAIVESVKREISIGEKNASLMAEKAAEGEARQRLAATTTLNIQLAKIESDVRVLQRESVRQEQFSALENRLQTALTKIETKVDKLGDATSKIGSIETILMALSSRMERITDRIDEAAVKVKTV